MMTDIDVIIADPGPAGSLAAYKLAALGAPPLILEKSRFPRYKICGAGGCPGDRSMAEHLSGVNEALINREYDIAGFSVKGIKQNHHGDTYGIVSRDKTRRLFMQPIRNTRKMFGMMDRESSIFSGMPICWFLMPSILFLKRRMLRKTGGVQAIY